MPQTDPAPRRRSPHHDRLCGLPTFHLGFVRTLGSDVQRWIREAAKLFDEHGFTPAVVKLSRLLNHTAVALSGVDSAERAPTYWSYASKMIAGDLLRSWREDWQVLGAATLYDLLFLDGRHTLMDAAGGKVSTSDLLTTAEASGKPRGIVFMYDSLMHPSEISFMRHMFGSLFSVVAVGAPLHERHLRVRAWLLKDFPANDPIHKRLTRDSLTAWWLAGSRPDELDGLVESLLLREIRGERFPIEETRDWEIDPAAMLDINEAWGQGELFLRSPKPDLVSLRNPSTRRYQEEATLDAGSVRDLDRFVRQLFGFPFGTPTPDENGMSLAYVASRLSSDLSRRVGAAIIGQSGDLLAIGKNEAPRPGGGTYTEDSDPDFRDHRLSRGAISNPGYDENEARKYALAKRIATAVGDTTGADIDPTDVYDQGVDEITEWGRSVHAEMDALLTAARLGLSPVGGTIFTTTYPCHNCMRHLIASGVKRVVFVEPYPKSRATLMYADSVHDAWTTPWAHHAGNDDRGAPALLDFEGPVVEPFFGISSRRHADLFSWIDRKLPKAATGEGGSPPGQAAVWDRSSGTLRPSFFRLHAQPQLESLGVTGAFHSLWSDIEKVLPSYVGTLDIERMFGVGWTEKEPPENVQP